MNEEQDKSASALATATLDEILMRRKHLPSHAFFASSATLAGREISVESDDRDFIDSFFVAFGGGEARPGRCSRSSFVAATIVEPKGMDTPGYLRCYVEGRPSDVSRFFFGMSRPDCPYRHFPSESGSWTVVGLKDEDEPLFAYREAHCLFRRRWDWHDKVLALLFRGILALRRDIIFLHASSVAINGRGVLFLGGQGSGKTTVALALCARGHALLGDDIGCYAPKTGMIEAYLRPIGLRDGIRPRQIDEAIRSGSFRGFFRNDSLRIDAGTLLPLKRPEPVPLSAIVFLKGFSDRPLLTRSTPSREHVGMLQAFYSSLVNAPATQRTFELIQLMNRVEVYELVLGHPDETSAYLEERLTTS